jgi:putative oxidoreductase
MSALAQEGGVSRLWNLVEQLRSSLERIPLSIPQLLARLAIAGVFFRSGQSKIANWDLTVQLFQDEYHLPLIPPDLAATMGASFELGCSVLIVLGLLTRIAVLPLLGMTAVIEIFVYPQNWPEHLTWTALLIFLLLRGAGAYSLDHFIGSKFRQMR